MPLPTITETWVQLLTTGTPGARIAFVSVVDTMQQFAFRLKDFLISGSTAATKYTLKWSASGGTGPSGAGDATDRITSAATWTPRATVAAASQAWYLLTGALGEQILVAFQGASDDICRISFSPTGAFALAGTTTHQPTATDEQVILSATSVVNATASADRILHIWARDDAKGFRVGLFRSSVITAPVFGVEEFISGATSPASVPVPVWGFAFTSATLTSTTLNGGYAANSRGGLCRTLVSAVGFSAQIRFMIEGDSGTSALATYTFQPEAQGSGFAAYPLSMHSVTTGSRGRWGIPIDWWCCSPSGVAEGDGFGDSYQFVQMGAALWPNPSNTAPTIL